MGNGGQVGSGVNTCLSHSAGLVRILFLLVLAIELFFAGSQPTLTWNRNQASPSVVKPPSTQAGGSGLRRGRLRRHGGSSRSICNRRGETLQKGSKSKTFEIVGTRATNQIPVAVGYARTAAGRSVLLIGNILHTELSGRYGRLSFDLQVCLFFGIRCLLIDVKG